MNERPQGRKRRWPAVVAGLVVVLAATGAAVSTLGLSTDEVLVKARQLVADDRLAEARRLLYEIDPPHPDVVAALIREIDAEIAERKERGRAERAGRRAREALRAGDAESAANALAGGGPGTEEIREDVGRELAKRASRAARDWDLEEARRLLEIARRTWRQSPEVAGGEFELADRVRREAESRRLIEEALAARDRGDFVAARDLLRQAGALDGPPGSAGRVSELLEAIGEGVRRQESRQELMARVARLLDKGNVAGARAAIERYMKRSGDRSFSAQLDALTRLEEEGASDAYLPARRALRWLAAHQDPKDGGFHGATYGEICGEEECKKDRTKGHDAGLTGLALMAFTAFRHLDVLGEFSDPAKRSAAYLVAVTRKNGSLPGLHYDTAIAGLALLERVIVGGATVAEAEASERILDYLTTKGQLADGGWRYSPNYGASDSSVICWVMQTLDAGKRLGLDVEASAKPGLDCLGRLTTYDGQTGYTEVASGRTNLTAAALLVRLMNGGKADDLMNRGAASAIWSRVGAARRLFRDQRKRELAVTTFRKRWHDHYGWYYATYAFHRLGGRNWKEWSPLVKAALVGSQVDEGHLAGTFEPDRRYDRRAGRIYTTAINALTLEVTYRQ